MSDIPNNQLQPFGPMQADVTVTVPNVAVTVRPRVTKLKFDMSIPVPDALCELGRYTVNVNYGFVELAVPSGSFMSIRLKRISVGLGATVAELIEVAQADYEETILGALEPDAELYLDPAYQIVPVMRNEPMIDAASPAACDAFVAHAKLALPVIESKEDKA